MITKVSLLFDEQRIYIRNKRAAGRSSSLSKEREQQPQILKDSIRKRSIRASNQLSLPPHLPNIGDIL